MLKLVSFFWRKKVMVHSRSETSSESEFQLLYNLIDNCRAVSFDVYDTAVLRNVLNPTDIFNIVQKKINDYGWAVTDFKSLRIRAEEAARLASQKEDITIDDIYAQLSTSVKDEKLLRELKDIELEIETEFTVINSAMKKIYDYALSKGKRVLFISDMYLPQQFINDLLLGLGYHNFELYVSNEVGKSKGSGNLYSYISNSANIAYDSWIHIGDNYISDYKQAIEHGMQAYYYKPLRERINYKKAYSLEYSIVKALQINLLETSDDIGYWRKLGVSKVSSIFWGFTNWLIQELKEKQANNVFFLSRDGYLPFKIYEMMTDVYKDLPPAQYIYASRRVYQLPNILNMKREDALELLTAYNPALGQRITLAEIFRNIGLEQGKYHNLLDRYGFRSFEDELLSDADRERLKQMLNTIYHVIEDNFKSEKQLLIDYLDQEGMLNYQEINVVDVGWRGSTHLAIKELTNKSVNGFYFGTTDIVYPKIRENVEGYAFNLGSPKKNEKKVMENVMMFELLFSADHGSLIKLSRNSNGNIIPIIKENDTTENYIRDIHNGVIDAIKCYIKYCNYINDISIADCLFDYFIFLEEKNYEDLSEFSRLRVSVGIGDTEDSQPFVTAVNLRDYNQSRRKYEVEASKNLWKNALIIYGTRSDLKHIGFQFKRGDRWRWFWRERVVRGIRNPKKACKYILRRIRKW